MIGWPVAMHAMRGISAHSNGFQTCRAIHLLQMLLGSIDARRLRYKPPFPRPARRRLNRPASPIKRRQHPDGRAAAGFVTGPEDLLIETRARRGSTRPIPGGAGGRSWPDAHGAAQRLGAIPIRSTRSMFTANMSWNSAMNVPDTLRYLTDQNADGGYKIPHIIYSDAYYRRWSPMPI